MVKISYWFIIISLVGVIMYLLVGIIIKNDDVLVKENSEYLYYKR